MRRLVDGLLTLARADSNQAVLRRAPLRIDEALRAAADQMEPLAAANHILLRCDSLSAAECSADEERIHQLFLIVLDNAVKYTPEGGIVSLSCSRLHGTVRITVEDTGVGIAPDDLPHVFERFYRSDRVRTREHGGIGLGLAIARWIVDSHGGSIRAESRYGAGTTIHIQLPA
jgi:two-component system, OmpR family, sensor histidine kinase CiaH